MLFKKEEAQDLNDSFIIKSLRKILPLKEDVAEPHFLVKENGKRYATQFLLALLFIEASDLLFAVDSIPAVLAVTQDTFIVVTSNIFAIMGLRSLYFALSGILPMFRYIKYALAVILAFIGGEDGLERISEGIRLALPHFKRGVINCYRWIVNTINYCVSDCISCTRAS